MISICIPVYNCDVTTLVNDLEKQCKDCRIEYEILLLDDASTDTNLSGRNEKLANSVNVFYNTNPQNIGLARTRNRLGEQARYPYLLFIDSDARVVMHDYIVRYLKVCQPDAVCFGGCIYPKECLDPKYKLRWKYGKKREEGIGKYYSCFNFLIAKSVFLKYPFSENLYRYGYEDALFGVELENSDDVDVLFIDNPLLHPGLVASEEFLKRIDLSLSNLLIIENILREKNIEPAIRLLKVAELFEKKHLQSLVVFVWNILKTTCLKNLKGKNPSLFLLDFYKLGYFCNLKMRK